jgi:hypothetical protein
MAKVRTEGSNRQLPLFDSADLDTVGNPPAGSLTPEKALAILKEQGLNVSLEQASAVLSFLRKLASISLPKIIDK